MKMIFSAFFILMTGCASFNVKEEPSTTVTDISDLSRSDYYYHLAQNFYENGFYEKSIDHYRLALLHDHKNIPAIIGLAKSYHATQQTHLAFEEISHISTANLNEDTFELISNFYQQTRSYEKAFQCAKDYFTAFGSQRALWKMYEVSLRLKNWELLNTTLEILKSSEQPKTMVYIAEAEALKEFKEYDKSYNSLKVAEEISPLDELVLKKLVDINYQRKDWNRVFSYGEKYMKYQKRTIYISNLVAQAATFLKDYDSAIEHYKWLSSNTDDVSYKLKLSHVYFLNQKYDLAKQNYLDVLVKDGSSNEAKYYLGLTYEALNETSASVSQLEAVKKSSIYYPDAQIRLATNQYRAQQLEKALGRMKLASSHRPESLALYKSYAEFLIESKDFTEVLKLLRKAEVNVGLDSELLITKAYCEFRLGDQKSFLADLDKALKLDKLNVKIYEYLALLWYQERNQLSETEYLSKVALDLGSTNQHVQKILIWTYIDLNKTEIASRLLEEQYDKNPRDIFYAEMLSRLYKIQNIHSKARIFSNYAQKLKSNINSNFELEEKILNDSLINDFQRMPASFEL